MTLPLLRTLLHQKQVHHITKQLPTTYLWQQLQPPSASCTHFHNLHFCSLVLFFFFKIIFLCQTKNFKKKQRPFSKLRISTTSLPHDTRLPLPNQQPAAAATTPSTNAKGPLRLHGPSTNTDPPRRHRIQQLQHRHPLPGHRSTPKRYSSTREAPTNGSLKDMLTPSGSCCLPRRASPTINQLGPRHP